jgi:hypothetical protein
MRMNKYAVLGSGPAGLMSVKGILDGYGGFNEAMNNDVRIVVFSLGSPSQLFGAQYLHRPIPGFTTDEPVVVDYKLRGTTAGYRDKVYGPMWDGSVSPEDLGDPHPAWDIRSTYQALWARYGHLVMKVNVTPSWLQDMRKDVQWNLIINSIPRDRLCYGGHNFRATEVTAAGDAPELGIRLPITVPPNTVICNGEDNPSWYRASNIYGYKTIEWPGDIQMVPITSATRVRKPLDHNCICWEEGNILHVGRYGSWKKGVLSHEAYEDSKRSVELLSANRALF